MPDEHPEGGREEQQAVEQHHRQEEPEWSPPQTETPSNKAILQGLSERGASLDEFESDDQFLDYMAEMHRTFREAPPAEELERVRKLQPVVAEYAENAADFQRWRDEQEQARKSQEQGPEQPEKPKWQPPEISEMSQRMVDAGLVSLDGKTGLYTTESPQFQSNVRELNERLDWERRNGRRLLENPYSVIKEAGLEDDLSSLREQIKQEVLDEFRQLTERDQARTEVESFLNAHQSELFATTEDGQVRADPRSGEPILTEPGKAYRSAAATARSLLGMGGDEEPDPQQAKRIHEFAWAQASRVLGESGVESGDDRREAPSPRESRRKQQETFLERAKRNGRRGQTDRLAERDARIASAAEREAREIVNEDQLWSASMKEAQAEMV